MTILAKSDKSAPPKPSDTSEQDLTGLRECLSYLREEALAAKQEVVALHLLIAIQELENSRRPASQS